MSDHKNLHGWITHPAMMSALAVVVTGLTGCLEQSDDLLGTDPLPALDPSEASVTWTGSSKPSLRTAQDPDPWSRDDWNHVRITVPMSSTIHEPTYVSHALDDRGDTTAGRLVPPRAFPTSESSLVMDTDRDEVVLNALAAPFVASWDLVVSPIRMILMPPWTRFEGPRGGWVLLPGIQVIDPEDAS